MTQYPDLFAALAAPFQPGEIKTKPGQGGKQLHYVTSRTVANRLDSTIGPECWEFSLSPWGDHDLIGTLTITLPDGRKVSKSDVGGRADMQASDDDAKSAASDCLKRCAALLGVGRYLYRDGSATFAADHEMQQHTSRPVQQAAAAPQANGAANHQQHHQADHRPHHQAQQQEDRIPDHYGKRPQSGKGMFAWCKEMEQKYEVALIGYLNGWAKQQGFPGRMVDWDDGQLAAGYQEAVRKLDSLGAHPEDESQDGPSQAQPPQPQAQPPARQPVVTDRTKLAEEFAMKAAKAKLIGLIWKLAQAKHGVANADDGKFYESMAEIDTVMAAQGKQVISDINECKAADLLSDYIQIAEDQLQFIGGTA